MTPAEQNNNPGNLKDPSTGTFQKFNSPQEGMAALMNDLETKKSGKSKSGLTPDSTLVDFSKVYAPSSDRNNPAQHAANIANYLGVRPDAKIGTLDTAKWAEGVANAEDSNFFSKLKSQGKSSKPTPPSPVNQSEPQAESGYQPWFKSSPDDSGFVAGAKALGNTIPSAINFGKGLLGAINPINTLENLSQIPEAFKGALDANQGNVAQTVANTIGAVPNEAYKQIVPKSAQQLISGDVAGASKTMTEDPFGQVAPVVLAAEGGAKAVDNLATKNAMAEYAANPYTTKTIPKASTQFSDMFSKAVETGAKPVTSLAEKTFSGATSLAKNAGLSMVSQLLGKDPETIKTVLNNPQEFTKLKMDNESRGGLAGEVQSKIESRMADLSDMGKGYQDIRKSPENVTVDNSFIKNALTDKGFKIKGGKILADTNSITRNPADIRAVQEFYNNWGKKKSFTRNEFLNMRSDLQGLSKFDKLTGMGKSPASETIGKDLYAKANSNIRDVHFPELKALDDSYAPEREALGKIQKDYFNKDGTFKDNAPSKIMNATNKVELLKRLENIMPGVTKRIQILRVVEELQKENKPGTYGRILPTLIGYGTAGLSGALIAELIKSPGTAVSILRKAGYTGQKLGQAIEQLKVLGGKVDTSRKGILSTVMNKNQSSSAK